MAETQRAMALTCTACKEEIVGTTEAELIENYRRHSMERHHYPMVEQEVRRLLEKQRKSG